MRIAIIKSVGRRAGLMAKALYEGIPKAGDDAEIIPGTFYSTPEHDGAAFYGLKDRCSQAFHDYKRQKFVVYIDMGYWGRREGGTYAGFHKIAVNSRHPDKYYQKFRHNSDRFDRFGVPIIPWKKDGKHILIAGMGNKAAPAAGFEVNEWESAAVTELQRHTDRDIWYRPKPSWGSPIPIDGTIYCDPVQMHLHDAFRDCWAVVAHHSNVCVEAVLAGIPVFCWHGVGKDMGLQDLSKIESPIYPGGRYQWASDIAYTQWRPCEIAEGTPWKRLKAEGIIP